MGKDFESRSSAHARAAVRLGPLLCSAVAWVFAGCAPAAPAAPAATEGQGAGPGAQPVATSAAAPGSAGAGSADSAPDAHGDPVATGAHPQVEPEQADSEAELADIADPVLRAAYIRARQQ